MTKDPFNYMKLTNDCFLQLVQKIVRITQDEGLSHGHYFTVTFLTSYKGAVVPQFLKNNYPNEITIVLEHQFWNLDIQEEGFFVTLSFNDEMTPIYIPWNAITLFSDPSTSFSLMLNSSHSGEQETITKPESLPKVSSNLEQIKPVHKNSKKPKKGKIIELSFTEE